MKQLIFKSSLVLLLTGLVLFSSSFKIGKPAANLKKEKVIHNPVPLSGTFEIKSDVNGNIIGTGIASHLGKFVWTANDNEETFPVITGTEVMTAANGDQIFVTHTGYVTDLGNNMLQADFDNTITGGTGRFTGATGHYETSAIVTATSVTGVINGTIDY